jgi:hypothetical protein
MTNRFGKLIAGIMFTGTVITSSPLLAQTATVEKTVTTSMGTISEFGPERIIIRSESSPSPITYTSSKTTTYVDEAGLPVSMETVKPGLPVTVYYDQVGGSMVATKVLVRKAAIVPDVLIEKKTTTTTTE